MIQLGDIYHQEGLKWGIGFSPFEIYLHYDTQAIQDLETKIRYFNHLKVDILAVLFDDMRGDYSEISKIQVDIVHRIAELSNAETFIMCPTYDQIPLNIKQHLSQKYEAFDSPYACEIVQWLKEEYLFSPECLTG